MTPAAQFNSRGFDPLDYFGKPCEELPILISDGMGVESATIVARLAENPGLMPGFSWERAIVITAQTGGEYESTRRLRERHILPILRDLGVRTVQVARRGPKEEDGITVLDDTTEPYTVYIEGDYTLERDEFAAALAPRVDQAGERFLSRARLSGDDDGPAGGRGAARISQQVRCALVRVDETFTRGCRLLYSLGRCLERDPRGGAQP